MGLFNFFRKRGIPERIRINREEYYHTHYIGKTADGRQFFLYPTYIYPDPVTRSLDTREEYVVLYLFDKRGNHLETKHWYAGVTDEGTERRVWNKLDEMVAEIGPVEYTSIKVKPFQTIIDGIVFGLVPNEERRCVYLQPSSTISFMAPWDGEYFS